MKYSNIRNVGLFALAAAVSTPAIADGLNYNYVEGAYIDTEIDVGSQDIDGDGVGVRGSFELGESVFVTASFATQEFDGSVDLDQWSVGIGGHLPISDKVDFVGTLRYVDADVQTNFGSTDDDGFGLGVGVRARVADQVELEGGLNYIDLDDSGDDTSFSVGGRYYFTNEFAVGAGYEFGDDVNTLSLAARYEF